MNFTDFNKGMAAFAAGYLTLQAGVGGVFYNHLDSNNYTKAETEELWNETNGIDLLMFGKPAAIAAYYLKEAEK